MQMSKKCLFSSHMAHPAIYSLTRFPWHDGMLVLARNSLRCNVKCCRNSARCNVKCCRNSARCTVKCCRNSARCNVKCCLKKQRAIQVDTFLMMIVMIMMIRKFNNWINTSSYTKVEDMIHLIMIYRTMSHISHLF